MLLGLKGKTEIADEEFYGITIKVGKVILGLDKQEDANSRGSLLGARLV